MRQIRRALRRSPRDLSRRLGDEAHVTETIEARSWTAVGRGDFEPAMARANEALQRYRGRRRPGGHRPLGFLDQERAFFMRAWAGPQRRHSPSRERPSTAARAQGNAWDMANSQGEMADIYRRMGDIPSAIREFNITPSSTTHWAISACCPGSSCWHASRSIAATGNVLRPLPRLRSDAVEDLGGELPEEMIQVGDPLSDARVQLPAEAYERALERGRAMSFEAAVAFALEA